MTSEVGAIQLDIPGMLRAVDEALKAELLRYADVMPMSQITMGKVALLAPGKVMSAVYSLDKGEPPNPMPRWPLFVLLSCQACNPEDAGAWRKAVLAAVAVEVAMAAADLIDEITDEDPSPFIREYGPGQALNTGSLMLVMAQQMLVRSGVEPGADGAGKASLLACQALQDVLVQAAVGQHLDMQYGDMGPDEVDLEMSVKMTALKAGALVSGACRIGAIMAEAPEEIVELIARIGKEMGSLAQVLNDIQDVTPLPEGEESGGFPERKTDLKRRKRTLPIVFTLREEVEEPNLVQRAFSDPSGQSAYDEEELRRAVMNAGGLHFANLIGEVHKQNGLEALAQLETLRPGATAVMSPLL
jgi:geranylgeranyl pyrophosphate synthase